MRGHMYCKYGLGSHLRARQSVNPFEFSSVWEQMACERKNGGKRSNIQCRLAKKSSEDQQRNPSLYPLTPIPPQGGARCTGPSAARAAARCSSECTRHPGKWSHLCVAGNWLRGGRRIRPFFHRPCFNSPLNKKLKKIKVQHSYWIARKMTLVWEQLTSGTLSSWLLGKIEKKPLAQS